MSDVKNAYDQIVDFLSNDTEKTLLLRGVADKDKHKTLLKALNAQGNLKGLIFLTHTTIDGIQNFFRWAELYKVKSPSKYGQAMKLSHLTLFFDNLTTRNNSRKYENYAFDFMIIWPIQSISENAKEIKALEEMAERQNTRKIIFLSIKEPWYNPDSFEPIVDRVIKLDCENDDPKEYQRIMNAYREDRN